MIGRASSASLLQAVIAAALSVCAGSNLATAQEFTLDEGDEWRVLDESVLDRTTPEGQLAEARAALAGGEHRKALSLASTWIDRHPRHPLLAEAYLIRGDAKLARGDDFEALFDYEFIARSFHGSDVWVTALERELQIAKDYARGKRRKLFGIRMVNASDEAEELFIRIQERMPGSQLGEEAGMELGDFYFERQNMTLAAEAYDLFIENYPRSPRISKARRRLIYANLASFKGPAFDASGLHEARYRLQELQLLEPTTAEEVGAEALLVRLDESDAEKLLENARWYRRTGDFISSELTIRRLVQQYPGTVAGREALDLALSLLPRLPQNVRDEAPDYEAIRAGADAAAATRSEEESRQ